MSDSIRFLQRGRHETFDAGATIFDHDDPCSDGDVFYIVSGMVRVVSSANDPMLAKRHLGTGDVFGVVEPYSGLRHRRHEAVAITPTEVYRWNRKGFDDAMGIYQELATKVIKTLSKNLRELNRGKKS